MDHEPCEKVIAMESRVETRHTLMMWFMGVVGVCIVGTASLVMSVGTDITATLLKVSNTQTKLSTSMQTITEEVKNLRDWRTHTTEGYEDRN